MESLENVLKKVVGLSIWDFRISESTGSIISFECGNKCLLENNEDRQFEGNYSFMVYCSWKICKNNKLIGSWKDEIEALNNIFTSMENAKIKQIVLTEVFDLKISLSDGCDLYVFCDLGEMADFDCNWFFRELENYYSVNNMLEVEVE